MMKQRKALTGLMHRLIWVFARYTGHFDGFFMHLADMDLDARKPDFSFLLCCMRTTESQTSLHTSAQFDIRFQSSVSLYTEVHVYIHSIVLLINEAG